MADSKQESFLDLERRSSECGKRVAALVAASDAASLEEAPVLEEETQCLLKALRRIAEEQSIPAARARLTQRILEGAIEALAKHRRKQTAPSLFSFQKNPTSQAAASALDCEVKKNNSEEEAEEDVEEDAQVPDDVVAFRGISDKTLLLSRGELRGREIWLSDVKRCTIFLLDRVSSARLRHLEDCAVVTPCVEAAMWLTDCRRCLFAVCTQQLRVHDSREVAFFLRVNSAPIIERTSEALFAPAVFELANKGGAEKAVAQSDAALWRDVQDFNWIKPQKSPNWNVLAEELDSSILDCTPRNCNSAVREVEGDAAQFFAEASEDFAVVSSATHELRGALASFSAPHLQRHSTLRAAAEAVVEESRKRRPEREHHERDTAKENLDDEI